MSNLKIKFIDRLNGETAHLETSVVTLPDHLQFDDQKFQEILAALEAFFKEHPDIRKIDVTVVPDSEG